VFGASGGQAGAGAGRHPKDQQRATAATGRGTDVRGDGPTRPVTDRPTDRRLPVDVRTVVRPGPGRRRGRLPKCEWPADGRCGHSNGHGAGGQAQTVHVGHCGLQPGVLRASTACGHFAGHQPGGPAVSAHDTRKRVQSAWRKSGSGTSVTSSTIQETV